MEKKEHFIQIVKANEGLIYKITALYTNTVTDRDDLYQEIVYQLWKSFDSFNNKSKISTWIYRVAMNTAIYHLNKAKRRVETTEIDQEVFKISNENDHELEEKIKVMHQHIQQLNALDKGIVLLFLEGKNYTEIGEITGLSPSNVGTKLSRIKEKLKKRNTQTQENGSQRTTKYMV